MKGLPLLLHSPELFFRKAWDPLRAKMAPRGVHPPYLHEVTLLLTFRCPLRCLMCPEWGEKGVFLGREKELKEGELEPKAWLKIIQQLRGWKPALVVLGGGEPFLYRGWEVLSRELQQFTRVVVISNGQSLEAEMPHLFQSVDILHISLDGGRAHHDSLRGEGSYDRTLKQVEKLLRLRKERRERKPIVRIAATAYPGERGSLQELAEDVFGLGCDGLIVQHLMFLRREELQRIEEASVPFDPHFWSGYGLTLEHAKELVEELRSFERFAKASPYSHRIQFHPSLSEKELELFYLSKNRPLSHFKRGCQAPYQQIILLPNAEVWLCPGFSCGNLQEESLSSILQGERAVQLYGALDQEFPFSVCAGCCYLYSYAK